MILFLMFSVIFALMNRARGSQFFDLTGSTTLGRLSSTGIMAATVTIFILLNNNLSAYFIFIPLWSLLYTWTIFKWDAYWAAAIGNDTTHSKLWGVGMMTLRNLLLLPYYGLLTYLSGNYLHSGFSATILLMGVTYYLSGRFTPGVNVIRNPELVNGAIIGATTWAILYA